MIGHPWETKRVRRRRLLASYQTVVILLVWIAAAIPPYDMKSELPVLLLAIADTGFVAWMWVEYRRELVEMIIERMTGV